MTRRSVPPLVFSGVGRLFPGGRAALSEVSLAVGPGVTAVVGANGAGKTTLLRLAAGLLRPTTGRITWGPIEPAMDLSAYRDCVGYLPQAPDFYDEMTPDGFLRHLAGLKLIPPEFVPDRIRAVLGAVGLDPGGWTLRTRIAALSRGQRLRLAVAQAILNDPCILVLDEPRDGLDSDGRLQLFDVIRRASSGRIVLFSTHILGDLVDLADSVVHLRGGLVAFHGPIGGYLSPVGRSTADPDGAVARAYGYWEGRMPYA